MEMCSLNVWRLLRGLEALEKFFVNLRRWLFGCGTQKMEIFDDKTLPENFTGNEAVDGKKIQFATIQ